VRVVQYKQLGYFYFDIARCELCVVRSFGTGNDLAFDSNDEFAADVLRLRMSLSGGFRTDHDLRNAFAVTKVDKCKNAEIALLCDPAHQNDAFADISLTQFTARMRALQIS